MKTILTAATDLVTVAGCLGAIWNLAIGRPVAALAAIGAAWVARRVGV